jgi:potassium efflux system protein
LPSVSALKRAVRETHEEVKPVLARLANLDEQHDRLKDLDASLAKFMDTAGAVPPGTDRATVESLAREALAAQLAVVQSLLTDYRRLWSGLTALDVLEKQLLEKTESFIHFIDEYVLWLPSGRPLYDMRLPRHLTPASDTWKIIGKELRKDVTGHPVPYLIFVLGLGVWIALYPKTRSLQRRIPELVGHAFTDSFALTLRALAIALYIAIPGLVLPWFVSDRLMTAVPTKDAGTYEFAEAMAEALRISILPVVLLLFFRHLCRPKGVAEVHFQWDTNVVRTLRRNFTWLMWVGIPLVLVTDFALEHPDEAWSTSVSRIGFVLLMLILSLFFSRVLHPEHGAFPPRNLHGRFGRLLTAKEWLYLSTVALPLGLAAGAIYTYPHTAMELARRLSRTLFLIFGLVVARSTLVRFVLVSQRRLALEQAKRQREGERSDATADTEAPAPDEPLPSRETIKNETRILLRWAVGLGLIICVWGIWQDLSPAFSFMNRVELWSYGTRAAGSQGASQASSAAGHEVVYLSDLIFALVAAMVTGVLAKHGPVIINIVLLSRLPIDAAARFAVTTLIRYVIIIVGVAVSFNAIGIGWSRVQWLAAGITVGLGFGLQEIFANFVSGLIVLFERPVRIGDVVTVGGVDGKITRIRMRATTVTDWNRRELIVPNKEFITGQIINWSLSDPVIRIDIPVGIAYGSNTRLARDMLLKAAKECPYVLEDPAPAALFRGFGDSTLNWELRVFIPHRDVWPDMSHELHTRIDDEFRRAGIEIAFPQRDIHIRSVPDGSSAIDRKEIPDARLESERGPRDP